MDLSSPTSGHSKACRLDTSKSFIDHAVSAEVLEKAPALIESPCISVSESLTLAAYVSWFLLGFPIMRDHAVHTKSCPFRQNHAISGHPIAWMFPPILVEFVGLPKKRIQFLFLRVAPIPVISVLLLRCATVELLKLCPWPPQGGHAMKQQAKHVATSVCEHRQTDIFMGFSKL